MFPNCLPFIQYSDVYNVYSVIVNNFISLPSLAWPNPAALCLLIGT